MSRSATIFLQVVIALIGVGVLALLLWEPHLEGRNVNATVYQIYFNDPFLAYAYTVSTAFFVALFQAFKLLNYSRQNKLFSPASVHALRTIKYCALVLVVFTLAPLAFLFIVRPGDDDIAGGVAIGLMLIFISTAFGTAAAVFEKTLQTAIDIKLENDLVSTLSSIHSCLSD